MKQILGTCCSGLYPLTSLHLLCVLSQALRDTKLLNIVSNSKKDISTWGFV